MLLAQAAEAANRVDWPQALMGIVGFIVAGWIATTFIKKMSE